MVRFDYVMGSFVVVGNMSGFTVVDKAEGVVGSIVNLAGTENCLSY